MVLAVTSLPGWRLWGAHGTNRLRRLSSTKGTTNVQWPCVCWSHQPRKGKIFLRLGLDNLSFPVLLLVKSGSQFQSGPPPPLPEVDHTSSLVWLFSQPMRRYLLQHSWSLPNNWRENLAVGIEHLLNAPRPSQTPGAGAPVVFV